MAEISENKYSNKSPQKNRKEKARGLLLSQKISLAITLFALGSTVLGTILVDTTASQTIEKEVRQEVKTAREIFEHFQELRFQNLLSANRIVAETPYLKAVVTTPDLDPELTDQIAEQVRSTAQSDFLAIFDSDMLMLSEANTIGSLQEGFIQKPAIQTVLETGEDYRGIWAFQENLLQVVASPFQLNETIVGVLVTGFAINEQTIASLEKMTNMRVSILGAEQFISAKASRSFFSELARQGALPVSEIVKTAVGGENYFMWISSTGEGSVHYVLARSLDEKFLYYQALRWKLISLALIILLVALVAGILYSRRLTRPIRSLVEGAHRLARRDFSSKVAMVTHDEIGQLAGSFNQMTDDLKRSHDELLADIQKRKLLEGQLTQLYESSKAIFSTVNRDEMLQIVMNTMHKMLHADEGSIMLFNDQNELYIAASRGIPEEVVKKVRLKPGEGVAGRCIEMQKDFLIVGSVEKYPEFKGLKANGRIKSSIVCPLMNQGVVLGVVTLNRSLNIEPFTQDNLNYAMTFSTQVAQAVQNTALYERLEKKVEEVNRAYSKLSEAQHQLVESEKLASIGRLVAGVAHELNNPLTAIIGYSELILNQKLDPKLERRLKTVRSQSYQCRNIVQNLLVFARRGELHLEPAGLTSIVKGALETVTLKLQRIHTKVLTHFPKEDIRLKADAQKLKQVIANIMSNAWHAMKDKKDSNQLEITVSEERGKAYIQIRDTGMGIKPENKSKIFEPFFTTKDEGEGTGLGLSLCYGIVKAHGGTIWVDSELGKGSTFTIELPIASGKELEGVRPKPSKEHLALTMNGDIRVLLIEDEQSIVDFTLQALELNGVHNVEVAHNGKIGLDKIKNFEYDLIICDYRLPGMDGNAILEGALQHKQDIEKQFLLISGFVGYGGEADEFVRKNRLNALPKPFSSEELMTAIHKTLASLAN